MWLVNLIVLWLNHYTLIKSIKFIMKIRIKRAADPTQSLNCWILLCILYLKTNFASTLLWVGLVFDVSQLECELQLNKLTLVTWEERFPCKELILSLSALSLSLFVVLSLSPFLFRTRHRLSVKLFRATTNDYFRLKYFLD